MFPKRAVASLLSIGGISGDPGGILIAGLAPKLFKYYRINGHIQTGCYSMFIICGLVYITACLLLKLIIPEEKKMTTDNL